jgi:hypothetical protein
MAAMAARSARAVEGIAAGSEASYPGGGDQQDIVHVAQKDGCLLWEVVLKKQAAEDKFGFTQANGRMDFEARTMTSQRSPHNARSPSRPSPTSAPEVLVVRKVHDHGLLKLWNLRHSGAEVKPQDRIVRVNGEVTVEGMQREIRSQRVLMNIVRYPDFFEVTLSREGGKKLGFRFERPQNPTAEGVRITEVLAEGALPDHNASQSVLGRWHNVVLPDMRIESINGISGDSVEIVAELKRAGAVRLVIRRAEQEAAMRHQMRQHVAELATTAGTGSSSQSPNGASQRGPELPRLM